MCCAASQEIAVCLYLPVFAFQLCLPHWHGHHSSGDLSPSHAVLAHQPQVHADQSLGRHASHAPKCCLLVPHFTTSYAGHNAIVSVLAVQDTNQGIAGTAELRRIPTTRAASGVLSKWDHLDSSASFRQGAQLVMDFKFTTTTSRWATATQATLATWNIPLRVC